MIDWSSLLSHKQTLLFFLSGSLNVETQTSPTVSECLVVIFGNPCLESFLDVFSTPLRTKIHDTQDDCKTEKSVTNYEAFPPMIKFTSFPCFIFLQCPVCFFLSRRHSTVFCSGRKTFHPDVDNDVQKRQANIKQDQNFRRRCKISFKCLKKVTNCIALHNKS